MRKLLFLILFFGLAIPAHAGSIASDAGASDTNSSSGWNCVKSIEAGSDHSYYILTCRGDATSEQQANANGDYFSNFQFATLFPGDATADWTSLEILISASDNGRVCLDVSASVDYSATVGVNYQKIAEIRKEFATADIGKWFYVPMTLGGPFTLKREDGTACTTSTCRYDLINWQIRRITNRTYVGSTYPAGYCAPGLTDSTVYNTGDIKIAFIFTKY